MDIMCCCSYVPPLHPAVRARFVMQPFAPPPHPAVRARFVAGYQRLIDRDRWKESTSALHVVSRDRRKCIHQESRQRRFDWQSQVFLRICFERATPGLTTSVYLSPLESAPTSDHLQRICLHVPRAIRFSCMPAEWANLCFIFELPVDAIRTVLQFVPLSIRSSRGHTWNVISAMRRPDRQLILFLKHVVIYLLWIHALYKRCAYEERKQFWLLSMTETETESLLGEHWPQGVASEVYCGLHAILGYMFENGGLGDLDFGSFAQNNTFGLTAIGTSILRKLVSKIKHVQISWAEFCQLATSHDKSFSGSLTFCFLHSGFYTSGTIWQRYAAIWRSVWEEDRSVRCGPKAINLYLGIGVHRTGMFVYNSRASMYMTSLQNAFDDTVMEEID